MAIGQQPSLQSPAQCSARATTSIPHSSPCFLQCPGLRLPPNAWQERARARCLHPPRIALGCPMKPPPRKPWPQKPLPAMHCQVPQRPGTVQRTWWWNQGQQQMRAIVVHRLSAVKHSDSGPAPPTAATPPRPPRDTRATTSIPHSSPCFLQCPGLRLPPNAWQERARARCLHPPHIALGCPIKPPPRPPWPQKPLPAMHCQVPQRPGTVQRSWEWNQGQQQMRAVVHHRLSAVKHSHSGPAPPAAVTPPGPQRDTRATTSIPHSSPCFLQCPGLRLPPNAWQERARARCLHPQRIALGCPIKPPPRPPWPQKPLPAMHCQVPQRPGTVQRSWEWNQGQQQMRAVVDHRLSAVKHSDSGPAPPAGATPPGPPQDAVAALTLDGNCSAAISAVPSPVQRQSDHLHPTLIPMLSPVSRTQTPAKCMAREGQSSLPPSPTHCPWLPYQATSTKTLATEAPPRHALPSPPETRHCAAHMVVEPGPAADEGDCGSQSVSCEAL
ncbi:uncharacterized protein LOC143405156 [Callospermophilus lateralis]|uniref:uncharacterized protein LOC143405156 n=1 Tax=Callospermophilus lateralis TaxID=76772 RepID=UPI0040385530